MNMVQSVITVAPIPRTNFLRVSKQHEIGTPISLGWAVTALSFNFLQN
jgi:hypothetical protein